MQVSDFIAEFLAKNKAGYLFKNNNLNSLTDCLENFLEDNVLVKNNKILLAKKNSKFFTMFNHYNEIKKLLNL